MKLQKKIFKLLGYIIGGIYTIYYLYLISFEVMPSIINQYCSSLLVTSLLFVFAIFGYLYSYFDRDMGSFMIIIGSVAIGIRYYISSLSISHSLFLSIPMLIGGALLWFSIEKEDS